jgi:hypothetical protein
MGMKLDLSHLWGFENRVLRKIYGAEEKGSNRVIKKIT